MAYKCEILADSISEQGHRLTTFKLTYPRIIHAEMLRHRMLSRNVASSRAIPFEKMVKDVEEDPFIPIAWQKIHKGMQGSEYITDQKIIDFKTGVWLKARDEAVHRAKELNGNLQRAKSIFDIEELEDTGVTKQLCNRLLEPFVWTTELVSGTEWENFFELRCPKYKLPLEEVRSKKEAINLYLNIYGNFTELDWLKINKSQAEIHIQKIAEMMWDCYSESVPKQLKAGDWHIPYGDKIAHGKLADVLGFKISDYDCYLKLMWSKIKIATARAARLSYETLGDNPRIDYEADIKLHDRLLESKHLSCFEHCAKVMTKQEYTGFHLYQGNNDPFDEKGKDIYGVCNNYRGFIQYRYLIENQ